MAKKPGGLGRGLGSLFGEMDVDLSVLDPAEISIEPQAESKPKKTGRVFITREMMKKEGPFYIHCTEGKDRGGFVSLMLEALSGADRMRAVGFNESEDHEADGGDGTNQTLRLQALGQVGSINRTIQQIDEALHRIDDGSYGVCTVCGQLIRKPRLINQPFVLTCMECQSEMERAAK